MNNQYHDNLNEEPEHEFDPQNKDKNLTLSLLIGVIQWPTTYRTAEIMQEKTDNYITSSLNETMSNNLLELRVCSSNTEYSSKQIPRLYIRCRIKFVTNNVFIIMSIYELFIFQL